MKKKRKKKQQKDFSLIIYSLAFVVAASLMLFLMFSGANKSEVTIKQEKVPVQQEANKQEVTNEQNEKAIIQTKAPQVANPTIGNNIADFELFDYKINYEINIRGTIRNVNFIVPVPSSENEKQYILNSKMPIKPTKTYYDGATTFAEFYFPELKSQKLTITNEGQAKIRTYDLKTAKAINKNVTPETNLEKYLIAEEYIEVNDPLVKSYANKIKGETREEIIQNIYEFTQKHLTYKHIKGVSGAKKALKDRVGECSEYSAIMVALARAKGIPARVVIGNIAREQNTKHNWVEVYFDEYGWVTYDPTVMPLIVNIYKDGKVIRQEKRYEANKSITKYITSGKNLFTPYIFKYRTATQHSGSATVTEKIKINKIK